MPGCVEICCIQKSLTEVENGAIKNLILFGKGFTLKLNQECHGVRLVMVMSAFLQVHVSKKDRREQVCSASTLMFTLGNVNLEKFHQFITDDPDQMVYGIIRK